MNLEQKPQVNKGSEGDGKLRDQEKLREAIGKVSTISEIRDIVEADGWSGDFQQWVGPADREACNKWDELSLKEFKKASTIEDILMCIAQLPPRSMANKTRNFIEKCKHGRAFLADIEYTGNFILTEKLKIED